MVGGRPCYGDMRELDKCPNVPLVCCQDKELLSSMIFALVQQQFTSSRLVFVCLCDPLMIQPRRFRLLKLELNYKSEEAISANPNFEKSDEKHIGSTAGS